MVLVRAEECNALLDRSVVVTAVELRDDGFQVDHFAGADVVVVGMGGGQVEPQSQGDRHGGYLRT